MTDTEMAAWREFGHKVLLFSMEANKHAHAPIFTASYISDLANEAGRLLYPRYWKGEGQLDVAAWDVQFRELIKNSPNWQLSFEEAVVVGRSDLEAIQREARDCADAPEDKLAKQSGEAILEIVSRLLGEET